MNSKFVVLLIVAGLIGLVIVSSPKAQPKIPIESASETVRLRIGQEALVHASVDSAIEIYVDQPFTITENLKLRDLATGKDYPLPNEAWVRAQGYLAVARDKDAESEAEVLVRWRHVDTMFSFSRQVFSD
jgi:hypothetical protein